jgi:hypothetical protein
MTQEKERSREGWKEEGGKLKGFSGNDDEFHLGPAGSEVE